MGSKKVFGESGIGGHGHFHQLRELVKLASPLVLANGFNTLVSTAIIILAARFLAPSDYGRYAIVLGMVNSAQSILSAGITTWGTREIASDPTIVASTYASMLKALSVFGVLMLMGSVFSLSVLSLSGQVMVAAILLTTQSSVRSLSAAALSVLIAENRTIDVARVVAAETFARVLFIPLLLLLGMGIVGLAAGEMLAGVVRLSLAKRSAERSLTTMLSFREANATHAIVSSRKFWLTQSSFGFANRAQVVIVGRTGSELAGLYALGQRIFESTLIAIIPVTTVLIPRVTRQRKSLNRNALRRQFLFSMAVTTGAGMLVGSAVFVFSRFALPKVVGNEYQEVSDYFWLVSLAVVFLFASQIAYAYLLGSGYESFVAKSSWIIVFVQLIGLFFVAGSQRIDALFAFILVIYFTQTLVWFLGFLYLDRQNGGARADAQNAQ